MNKMDEELQTTTETVTTTEPDSRISKEELISTGININKKFILINSSLYTEEAFDYIKKLVDEAGAVAFISDTKRIWAQGQYFAGDIFKDDFHYFTRIGICDEDNENELKEFIETTKTQDQVRFKGEEGIYLYKSTNLVDLEGNVESTVNIGYDLHSRIDTGKFSMDANSTYHLDYVDGKIKMVKYTPCSVSISSLSPIEYDSGDTQVTLKFTISGTDKLTVFRLTCDNTDVQNSLDTSEYTKSKIIKATIPNNTTVKFSVEYSDNTTSGTTSVTQEWGYACIYAVEQITTDNYSTLSKYISPSSPNKTISISQNLGEYGYFACPSNWSPTFTDSSTNLQGGWMKDSKITLYTTNTVYQVYRTVNSGLGKVKWVIGTK